MHMTIRCIVYAKNRRGAVDNANVVFSRLVCGGHFDYHRISSSGHRVGTQTGKRLVGQGWRYTVQEFNRNMDVIRKSVKRKNHEIMNERGNLLLRYQFYCVGQYKGPNIWLYDHNGEGIRTADHLKNVLTKWKDHCKLEGIGNPYEKDDIWVVAADVHF